MSFYVYGIKSSRTDRIYVGQAKDIPQRLLRHNAGHVSSTKAHRPWMLVAEQKLETRADARWIELQLKKSRGKRELWLRCHAIAIETA